MGIDANDTDVFQLLRKLKDANGAYPQELLTPRRQEYLKQVLAISGGAGLAVALKNTAKSGSKAASLPPAAGTLLEGLLVIAIVVEAGTVSYLYRDKIKELFQTISNSPKVQEISNPPVLSSPVPGLEITVTPAVSETVIVTETETATPVGTPSLLAEQPTNQAGSQGSGSTNGSGSGSSAVSTPASNGSNGNNGNQYGHTPIPERTKDPGKNNPNITPDSKKGK